MIISISKVIKLELYNTNSHHNNNTIAITTTITKICAGAGLEAKLLPATSRCARYFVESPLSFLGKWLNEAGMAPRDSKSP